MSVAGGPDLIQDGLVLCLDAANTKSYPGSGTSWVDLSRNGNNATLTNGPTFSSADGGHMVFDGTNDYAVVSNSSSLNMGNKSFTADVWLAVTSFSSAERMILEYNVWGNSGTYQLTSYGNLIIINFVGTSQAGYTYTPFTTGVWLNFVGVFDNANNFRYIYINGSRAATQSTTEEIASAVSSLYIGSRGGGSLFLPCKMSSIKMYNRALSDAEILQNYNATKGRFRL